MEEYVSCAPRPLVAQSTGVFLMVRLHAVNISLCNRNWLRCSEVNRLMWALHHMTHLLFRPVGNLSCVSVSPGAHVCLINVCVSSILANQFSAHWSTEGDQCSDQINTINHGSFLTQTLTASNELSSENLSGTKVSLLLASTSVRINQS